MKPTIRSVKGTRDFFPEDMFLRTWLYSKVRNASQAFGYQEYDGPYLESLDLYAAKSGEELVKEQSFVFPDRSGDLIALRPELTPSLARMVASMEHSLNFPIRWWSYGPFWRYERPQKGRSREFFQWNIDLIGVESVAADAELVAIIAAFFADVGLSSQTVEILVNDRRFVDRHLKQLGIPSDDLTAIFQLIDRRDKMPATKWEKRASDIGLSINQITGLLEFISRHNIDQTPDEFQEFIRLCESLGISEYIRFDPGVIRGLDYYTGMVFEARDKNRAFRSILGGGRYNNLVEAIGGGKVPGVGFAMGDMVISLVLAEYNLLPAIPVSNCDLFITVFDETCLLESFKLSGELRRSGINTVCYPQNERISKQLKYADRNGFSFAVILGPEEIQQRMVALKDLRKHTQEMIPRDSFLSRIQYLLDPSLPS